VSSMDQLIEVLNEVRAGQDFVGAEDFFDQGILDSLDMTALVAGLESRYDIFVDVDEIIVDNFRNLASIRAFLARKGINH
jgi:acyl carrier protein